jgi:transposase
MAVDVIRRELSAVDLRAEAARSRDANATRRMLALALVLEGHSRRDAAEMCSMDRQTLRDWVPRYNADGLAGLSNRRPPGPEPRLSTEQEAELVRWLEDGPELSQPPAYGKVTTPSSRRMLQCLECANARMQTTMARHVSW